MNLVEMTEKIFDMDKVDQFQCNIGKKPEILENSDVKIEKKQSVPTISVISPSMSLGQFLEDTIISVANQSFKDFEHIVIDGGSTDETIEILKRHPHIIWISEKDSGYEEAIRKGLAIARGKYIMTCAISDGFLDRNWLKQCVEVLESDPDVSLVWGFPQNLTEDGLLGIVSYPQLHHTKPPQKYEWISYWLKTCFWLPEGNICVRREVFDRCFPAFEGFPPYRDPWLEFNFNFNSKGYLPYHIQAVANFGRIHKNQRGQLEVNSGIMRRRLKEYFRQVRYYRWQLLTGTIMIHIYRDGSHRPLQVTFSNEQFRKDYLKYILLRCKTLIQAGFYLYFIAKIKSIYKRVF